MLCRVADIVFWLARYMERTNGTLRLLRTNYISSQDEVKSISAGNPFSEVIATSHRRIEIDRQRFPENIGTPHA